MRGAPWEGLFYGFVLETVLGLGALVYALKTDDFLGRTVAWALVAVAVAAGARTLRRAARQPERPDRPVGRSWFGG
jgi:hypothetical protein